MPATRPRRIVRRAVMALVVVAVLLGIGLAWVAMREPLEIQRSRSLRLGMTKAEVEAVMGRSDAGWFIGSVNSGGISGLYFGRTVALRRRIFTWLGFKDDSRSIHWPVRVTFDATGRANAIDRAGEIERVPPQ